MHTLYCNHNFSGCVPNIRNLCMNTLKYPRLSCSWFQWKFYTVISFPVKTSSLWTEMIEIDIPVMSFPEFTELGRGRIFVEILPWLSSIKPLFWLHIRLCCNHCFDQRPHADSCVSTVRRQIVLRWSRFEIWLWCFKFKPNNTLTCTVVHMLDVGIMCIV